MLRILASFPIACFIGALATDIAYANSAEVMWADFSAWLLAAGLIIGVLAGLAGFVDLVVSRRTRPRPTGAIIVAGLVVFALAVIDNLVHSRDGWTSVVPLGLILSALLALVTAITVWLGTSRFVRVDAALVETRR